MEITKKGSENNVGLNTTIFDLIVLLKEKHRKKCLMNAK